MKLNEPLERVFDLTQTEAKLIEKYREAVAKLTPGGHCGRSWSFPVDSGDEIAVQVIITHQSTDPSISSGEWIIERARARLGRDTPE